MVDLTPAERVNRAGVEIGEALLPFISANAPIEGDADSWLPVLAARDKSDGKPPLQRSTRDARVVLLIVARYWKMFRQPTKPSQTAWANELLGTLNRVAHVPQFVTLIDLVTFLGIAHKLLASLSPRAAVLERIKLQTQDAMRDSLLSDDSVGDEAAPVVTSQPSSSPTKVSEESDLDDAENTNNKNDIASDDAKAEEARLVEYFFPRVPGSEVGLDCEFIAFRDLRMVVFYRKDINFALVHNRVSVFAGIGVSVGQEDVDGLNATPNIHEVSGLRARLSSLATEERSGWSGPGIELSDGQTWWAEPADLNWALPHDHFIGIDEATADTLELQFEYDGVLVQRSIPLRILAHDQWTPVTVPEIVAAFVRPRAAAVGTVLSTASDLLAERTGNPSLVGYQDSPDRVLETVRAIYDAIHSFGIRYSEPPASFETNGQKIRTADVVVENRFGTCLDTTVLFAAVMEEAGIQPYIVLLKGHSVVGFTLKEIATDMVISDSDQLGNLFGSGFFLTIETTLCVAGKEASFEDAVASAVETCKNGRAVRLAINVQAAHRRIKPLPSVVERDGERTILVVENKPSIERGFANSSARAPEEPAATVHLNGTNYPMRVQRWRSDLLDLSFRNPLLKLADSRGAKFLVNGEDLGELENRLAQNQSIQLTPHENVDAIDLEQGVQTASQYDEHKLSRLFLEEGRTFVSAQRGSALNKLTSLRRDAKSIKEDTGATALFVSLGLLKWKSAGTRGKAQEGRSPLFLLPVELTGSKTRPYSIRMEPNAEVQPNYCLIEKLRQEYNLVLPQLESPPADESGIDLPRVFQELRDVFLERGLDFAVEDRAHLAILQFASLDMWRDVGENWAELSQSPVVDHFINHPTEIFNDSAVRVDVTAADEVDTYLPLPADGSQLAAVKASSAGSSFVLEGPPGTGKSQTITNMIADGVARGRTILFVAEKQAALTVVHDRLRNVGLEPLVLNVHGKDQSINLVRDQIRKSIQAVAKGNASVVNEIRHQLRSHIEELETYPGVVHEDVHGASVWDRYQRCLVLEKNYPTNAGWTPEEISITPAVLETDRKAIRSIAATVDLAARRTRGKRLPQEWTFIGSVQPAGDRNDTGAIAGVASSIVEAAIALVAAANEVPPPLAELVDRLDGEQRERLDAWLADLPTNRAVLPRLLQMPRLSSADLVQRIHELHQFRQRWQLEQANFTPAALNADVATLQAEYDEAQRAGFMQRRRLTKLVLSKITAFAHPAQATSVEQDPLRFLTALGTFQKEHAEARSRLAAGLPGMSHVHLFSDDAMRLLTHEDQAARDWEAHAALTQALVSVAPSAGPVLDTLVEQDPRAAQAGEFGDAVNRFEHAWSELQRLSDATVASVTSWQQNRPLFVRIRECQSEWIRVASDSSAQLEFMRQAELQRVLIELAAVGLSAEAQAIQQGHATEHLAEAVELASERARLNAQLRGSDLDIFDAGKRATHVSEYVRLSAELKRHLWSELPAQLLGRRSDRASVSVGLRKEIDRKRGGAIRRIFENYGQEILHLTPVILMSPSSVARFLPVESVRFDTVIFDEASQVKVADAIGSLGRANSAVIVGDSKQMPPTNMFGTTADDDVDAGAAAALVGSLQGVPTNGGPAVGEQTGTSESEKDRGFALAAADQESILSEAVGTGLEQRWLSWHYRSKHESLISFSNVKYYNGNLQVFPGPPELREGLGVSVQHVDGQFDRGKTRTNEVEAQAIVRDITQRLASSPDASIGVVTFNTQQRDLILDLLEQSDSAVVRRSLERDSEPVFVKNLENVQGDERNTILFSIAFAKNLETGTLSHNFGPLNNSGGERRLNVAITRAREEVILYSSIHSADIDPAKTKAEGLLHLKEYLAYAEHGSLEAGGGALQFNADDLYRDELAQALRDAGLEVVVDVGTSKFRVDIAVRVNAEHGWLAVVLDTPEWAERETTADRESLPAEILQKVMGWRDTVQVLLPAWIQGRDATVATIVERAEALRIDFAEEPRPDVPGEEAENPDAPHGPSVDTKDIPSEEDSCSELDGSTTLDIASAVHERLGELSHAMDPLAPMRSASQVREDEGPVPSPDFAGEYSFVEASLELVGEPGVLDALADPHHRMTVQEQLTEIIETEGPVEEQRLARVLGNRFGLSRVSRSRIAQILACTTAQPERSREFGAFYWPSTIVRDEYTGYRPRYDAELTLSVNEISHRELGNAMVHVLRESGTLPAESLLRETMGIFGWSRMGRQIRERLEAVVAWTVSAGLISKSPDGELVLAEQAVGSHTDQADGSAGG